MPKGSSPSRPVRDFDGLYKALLDDHPREVLTVLCGAKLDGREVIIEEPTEQPRQRSRLCDRVFLIPNEDGPDDVYHIEIQLKREDDFQERMVNYWSTLALKYHRETHRIHQVALWPEGGGHPGYFLRDYHWHQHVAVNIPDDLDPEVALAGDLAPLALWATKPPPYLVERVAYYIGTLQRKEEKLARIDLGMLRGGTLAAQLELMLRRMGMYNALKDTLTGREILEEGLSQGLSQGHVDGMRVLLRAKFGDIADLDELAKRLTVDDYDGNNARILAGATLDELRA